MTAKETFLNALKEHVGEWVCSNHNTANSNQPAAIFREVKKSGYEFEEISPNRWATKRHCDICNKETSHYKLIKLEPTLTSQERLSIDKQTRNRILKIFDKRDAFTGATISSTPEIDHKVPWTRLENDIDATVLSDEEVKNHFQLLTREHNLLKDRKCTICKKENIRPSFLGINFWYEGDEHYCGSCVGCGWYDGLAWRNAINEILSSNK